MFLTTFQNNHLKEFHSYKWNKVLNQNITHQYNHNNFNYNQNHNSRKSIQNLNKSIFN